MYTLTVENQIGNVLTLTQKENTYQIQQIEGLSPPEATINFTSIVGMDGAAFNSARIEPREIVLYIKINGNAEKNRINLYSFFSPKSPVKLYYKNGERNVFIEGYVSSFVCDLFSGDGEIAQISILCPSPYWKDAQEIVDDISNVLGLFTFPFFINEGEPIPFSEYTENRESVVYNFSLVDTGLLIRATFAGNVNSLEIRNTTTGEDFTVVYPFISGDILSINTNIGSKSVTLIRSGDEVNIFPYITQGSVFFQLHAGANTFEFEADSGASDDNVTIQLTRRTEYAGV